MTSKCERLCALYLAREDRPAEPSGKIVGGPDLIRPTQSVFDYGFERVHQVLRLLYPIFGYIGITPPGPTGKAESGKGI